MLKKDKKCLKSSLLFHGLFSSTSFINEVNTDLKFEGCKRMLTQTIHKYKGNLLSNFTFSNTTEAGNKGHLFTNLTSESRDI